MNLRTTSNDDRSVPPKITAKNRPWKNRRLLETRLVSKKDKNNTKNINGALLNRAAAT